MTDTAANPAPVETVDAASVATEVERLFARIFRERMSDFPLNNGALRVEAVGFRSCAAGVCGVLITPWSINLLLIPANDDGLHTGHKRLHAFPAGEFEFILSEEECFGRYEICSLFSPALQFADHASASETAQAVLAALFTAPDKQASRSEIAMTRLFRGDLQGAADVERDSAEVEDATATPKTPATPSRRDLFLGRLRATAPATGEEAAR